MTSQLLITLVQDTIERLGDDGRCSVILRVSLGMYDRCTLGIIDDWKYELLAEQC